MIRRLWAAARRLWARGRLPDALELWSGDPTVRRWSAASVSWCPLGVRGCAVLGDPHPCDAALHCWRVMAQVSNPWRWDVWAFYA